ncbi:MAG: tetratricopeptide repeat protein [Planctomycetes bacterium]|nr:tetratricopeptide repeat protein [Planctomycetota bacterium]
MSDVRAIVLALTLSWFASCGLFSSAPEEPDNTPSQILNHHGLERLAVGDLESAQRDFEEALEYAERLDDLISQAEAWNNLAHLERIRSADLGTSKDATNGLAMHERALALHREAENAVGEVRTLQNLGTWHLVGGDVDAARVAFEQALAIAQRIEDEPLADASRIGLAAVLVSTGKAQSALDLLDDVIERARDDGDRDRLAAALANRGAALMDLEQFPRARNVYEQCLALNRDREAPRQIAQDLEALRTIAEKVGDGPGVLRYALREARVRMRLGDVTGWGRALDAARTHLEAGDPGVAPLELRRLEDQLKQALDRERTRVSRIR